MQHPSDIGVAFLLLSELNDSISIGVQVDVGVVLVPDEKGIGFCLFVVFKEIMLAGSPVSKDQLTGFQGCLKN